VNPRTHSEFTDVGLYEKEYRHENHLYQQFFLAPLCSTALRCSQ